MTRCGEGVQVIFSQRRETIQNATRVLGSRFPFPSAHWVMAGFETPIDAQMFH